MEFCPNCDKHICVNTEFTHVCNFLELVVESNLFDLENSEEFLLMEFILSEDFISRHKKPRRIPSKIPRKLPRDLSNGLYNQFGGVVSITCKNTPLVYEYAAPEIDLAYLDN